MIPLNREQAIKIAEITSNVYQQGSTWVFETMDLDTGVTRLNRVFSERDAKRRLKSWRKERVELLLRSNPQQTAYTIRVWHENPSWKGQGIWRWAQNTWYLTRHEAEQALEKHGGKDQNRYEIFELPIAEIPGHFVNQ